MEASPVSWRLLCIGSHTTTARRTLQCNAMAKIQRKCTISAFRRFSRVRGFALAVPSFAFSTPFEVRGLLMHSFFPYNIISDFFRPYYPCFFSLFIVWQLGAKRLGRDHHMRPVIERFFVKKFQTKDTSLRIKMKVGIVVANPWTAVYTPPPPHQPGSAPLWTYCVTIRKFQVFALIICQVSGSHILCKSILGWGMNNEEEASFQSCWSYL